MPFRLHLVKGLTTSDASGWQLLKSIPDRLEKGKAATLQFMTGKRWELLQDYTNDADGGTCERQQMPYTRDAEHAAIAGALEEPR
jgi:hypothetical protein